MKKAESLRGVAAGTGGDGGDAKTVELDGDRRPEARELKRSILNRQARAQLAAQIYPAGHDCTTVRAARPNANLRCAASILALGPLYGDGGRRGAEATGRSPGGTEVAWGRTGGSRTSRQTADSAHRPLALLWRNDAW